MGYDAKGMKKDLKWMTEYLDENLQEAYRNERDNKDLVFAPCYRSLVVMQQAKCYIYNDMLKLMLEHDVIDEDDLACLTVSTREVKE